jgi:hypothetical protein
MIFRKILLNMLAVCTIAVVAGYMLAGPVWKLVLDRRARPGVTMGGAAPVRTLFGSTIPVRSDDSATFLLFLDAGCRACRRDARSYVIFARWAREHGAAIRLQLPNSDGAVRQFARLARDSTDFVMSSWKFYNELGVTFIPSSILVDRRGLVVARWGFEVPSMDDAAKKLATVVP